MQQGNGQQGNYGRHGEARGDDRDPLGRPLPSRGEDFGPERNMIPDEAAIERAREILEYLRNRANDAGRPRIELGKGAASPEEAAAIAAAIEQFLRDTAPAPAPPAGPTSFWLRSGLFEATGRSGGPSPWGDRERWGT